MLENSHGYRNPQIPMRRIHQPLRNIIDICTRSKFDLERQAVIWAWAVQNDSILTR